MMAEMIGLDGDLARRCGLLHDIGKAADHEMEGGHPKIGADLLKRNGERPEVVHAALGHHDEIITEYPYTMLVATADACSASRPGARRESAGAVHQADGRAGVDRQRVHGVSQAFAVQAGRELRVLANARNTDDERPPRSAATSPRHSKSADLPRRNQGDARAGIAIHRSCQIGRHACAAYWRCGGQTGPRDRRHRTAGAAQEPALDFVVVNGENSAAVPGSRRKVIARFRRAGADCVTLGDHIYRRRQIIASSASEEPHPQAGQLPGRSAGPRLDQTRGRQRYARGGDQLDRSRVHETGRLPVQNGGSRLAELPTNVKVILVDFHAEATSDMQLMGRYLDGRVTAVLGTTRMCRRPTNRSCPAGRRFNATLA